MEPAKEIQYYQQIGNFIINAILKAFKPELNRIIEILKK